MALAAPSLFFPAQCIRLCPCWSLCSDSPMSPATTVGECERRHSLRRHKGGLWTVRLSSFHRVLLHGVFFFSVSPGHTVSGTAGTPEWFAMKAEDVLHAGRMSTGGLRSTWVNVCDDGTSW